MSGRAAEFRSILALARTVAFGCLFAAALGCAVLGVHPQAASSSAHLSLAIGSSLLLFPWGSPRRRSNETLLDGERLRLLTSGDTSLDPFVILLAERDDGNRIVDLRIQFANRHAVQLLTGFESELAGRTLLQVVPSTFPSGFFDRICRVVDTGEPLIGEAQVHDPRVRASWLRYQIVRLGDGVAMTLGDISSVKTSERRYKELGEFTESIFESAPFSIFATDAEGMITAMNRAAEELCGYSRTDLVNKAPLTLLHDRKELAQRARDQKLRTDPSLEGFGRSHRESHAGRSRRAGVDPAPGRRHAGSHPPRGPGTQARG